MYVFSELGTAASGDLGTSVRQPAIERPETNDPDLTLYLVEVPEGWELRSGRGRGILYAGLSDPLRLAQGWVEEGQGRMLITRSART